MRKGQRTGFVDRLAVVLEFRASRRCGTSGSARKWTRKTFFSKNLVRRCVVGGRLLLLSVLQWKRHHHCAAEDKGTAYNNQVGSVVRGFGRAASPNNSVQSSARQSHLSSSFPLPIFCQSMRLKASVGVCRGGQRSVDEGSRPVGVDFREMLVRRGRRWNEETRLVKKDVLESFVGPGE